MKRVNPAVLAPLKDALTRLYWYKTDLRSFLKAATRDPNLIAQLDWSAYKREVASSLVDHMAQDQQRFFDVLVDLLLAVAGAPDPTHLLDLDDGQVKYDAAVAALATLKAQVEPYQRVRSRADEAERRRAVDAQLAKRQQAMAEDLATIHADFTAMHSAPAQTRGYALEKILNQVFTAYDIDSKGPFRTTGEQIDGAFTLEGTEFLIEAKWQQAPATTADLDVFAGKVARKLDNTLGLFVAMSGFQPNALDLTRQGGRPSVLLMDGSDLMLVLEGRVPLPDLLIRKRQHAARTGDVFLSARDVLG